MSETADEVMSKHRVEIALATTFRKWGGWPAVESGMVNMTGVMADSVLELHARAILAERLAERERAAKIADAKARDLKFNDLSARRHGARLEAEGYAYASDRCAEIASSIRSPDTTADRSSQSRPATGFLSTLTPEQREAALSFEGPDLLGDPARSSLKEGEGEAR